MNRAKAMQTVEELLKKNFKYLYKKEKMNIFEFKMSEDDDVIESEGFKLE